MDEMIARASVGASPHILDLQERAAIRDHANRLISNERSVLLKIERAEQEERMKVRQQTPEEERAELERRITDHAHTIF